MILHKNAWREGREKTTKLGEALQEAWNVSECASAKVKTERKPGTREPRKHRWRGCMDEDWSEDGCGVLAALERPGSWGVSWRSDSCQTLADICRTGDAETAWARCFGPRPSARLSPKK